MKPWEVAQQLGIREFCVLCSKVDAHASSTVQFDVLKVTRQDGNLVVLVRVGKDDLQEVRVA